MRVHFLNLAESRFARLVPHSLRSTPKNLHAKQLTARIERRCSIPLLAFRMHDYSFESSRCCTSVTNVDARLIENIMCNSVLARVKPT